MDNFSTKDKNDRRFYRCATEMRGKRLLTSFRSNEEGEDDESGGGRSVEEERGTSTVIQRRHGSQIKAHSSKLTAYSLQLTG